MKTAVWSTRRVAGQVDRSECAVRNCWEKWTREGTHALKTGSGATRKTTRREDRAASTCGLHSDSFNDTSRRRRMQLFHKQFPDTLQKQWCQARSLWNVTYWQKVVFSDESRFVWGADDNRVRVWRRPGERYNSPTLFYVTLPAQLV
ncbi:transposable element Tcb2 transposase [Trichonephila clavipes]|nr:transposable element Tcb2 transposase [Trichonephila clavipes]